MSFFNNKPAEEYQAERAKQKADAINDAYNTVARYGDMWRQVSQNNSENGYHSVGAALSANQNKQEADDEAERRLEEAMERFAGIDTSGLVYDNSPAYDTAFGDYDVPVTVTQQPKTDGGSGGDEYPIPAGANSIEYPEPQEVEIPSGTDIANEATAQATLNAKQQDYLNKQMRYAQGLLGKLQQPQAQTPIYDGRFGNTYNKTDLSSDEFYAQQYNNLRNAGLSDRRARREAARRAGEYRLQRISNINNAFNNFGLDDNGAVNPLGTQLIAAMGREDANQANVMHSLYPGLLDAYKARTAENIARMNNENKMALADARLRGQLEAIAARQANKQPSLNDIVFYSLLEQGYSPEQAYAFMRPNKTRDGGATSNEEKLTPTVQGKQQGVFNLLVAAQEAVQNGDKNPDVDGDAIEAAREAVNDAELHGYLKPEQIARSRVILDNLVNQREVKYGYKPKY